MTSSQDRKRIFLSPPHLSGEELELVKEAFTSNYIAPLGPMVDAFEQEFSDYTGIPHCLAVSSGTAAMHLALRHVLGSKGFPVSGSQVSSPPPDEEIPPPTAGADTGTLSERPVVLASTLTFIGSVSPIIYEHAEPVFIDCDPATWNMDPALLEQTLAAYDQEGIRPAAVIPTDLYGQCSNLPELQAICRKYGVPLICDAAEAMGARYKSSEKNRPWHHAGYNADAAIYSFNGNKMITSSGGGMLASHDEDLIKHARKLATQAREPAPFYEHREIGFNYRMSNIVAAIGLGQLRILNQRVDQARAVFAGYQERLDGLPGIDFMPEAPYNRCTRWLTVITVDPRQWGADNETIRLALEDENIEARPLWKPMHLQPVFRDCIIKNGTVSEKLFSTGLCLPSGTALTDSDLDRICNIIRKTRHSAQPNGHV